MTLSKSPYSCKPSQDLITALPAKSNDEIKKAGATPYILSLEDASVKDFAELFDKEKPDGVVFSAGAGGKGGEERTKAVDYEGMVRSPVLHDVD
jgi:hypothetical protein